MAQYHLPTTSVDKGDAAGKGVEEGSFPDTIIYH